MSHADEMGIGPVQPRGAQTIMEDFLQTAAGAPYRALYEEYLEGAV